MEDGAIVMIPKEETWLHVTTKTVASSGFIYLA